jgi:DNA ligase D-like protein (predicted ligase)/DNA ligase D-like protein (predicted 3'-phosphoesterase)
MKPHFKPMLAQTGRAPFNSKEWIFEIKWDGIRAIGYVDDELRIVSRNGRELKENFPEFLELKELAADVVLDGEIVVMKSGKADFQAILERSRSASARDIEYLSKESPATYIVFDILEKRGVSLIHLPLTERKRILRASLKEGQHIISSIFEEEDGKQYYDAAISRGIEGIVAKRKDSPYEPGTRSSNWLKIKELTSCDCVIFGYTSGQGNRKETFGALILGLYNGGEPVYIGKVGTGFSEDTLEMLMQTVRDLQVKDATLKQVEVTEKVTWVSPSLVCEVAYQSVTKDNRLRMPRFRRLRSDKTPLECTFDQIRPAGLQEYSSKRDFNLTPEPEGEVGKEEGTTFVVQEHHARRLHHDLRLERLGVLKSWAVPKGIPEKPGEKRLAVETEDHPLAYGGFEGTIPQGQYGAGTVKIWDRGSFQPLVWNDNKIEFILNGGRLVGRYVLARFKKAGEKQWILIRARD